MSEREEPEPERRRFAYGARKPGEQRERAEKESKDRLLAAQAAILSRVLPVLVAAIDLVALERPIRDRSDCDSAEIDALEAAVRALPPGMRAEIERRAKEIGKRKETK